MKCPASFSVQQGAHNAVKHECVRDIGHEGKHVCSCGTEWRVGKHQAGDDLKKGSPLNCQ